MEALNRANRRYAMTPLFLAAYVPMTRKRRDWRTEDEYYRRFAPRRRVRLPAVSAAAAATAFLALAGIVGD
jgi:hypothetical protein